MLEGRPSMRTVVSGTISAGMLGSSRLTNVCVKLRTNVSSGRTEPMVFLRWRNYNCLINFYQLVRAFIAGFDVDLRRRNIEKICEQIYNCFVRFPFFWDSCGPKLVFINPDLFDFIIMRVSSDV